MLKTLPHILNDSLYGWLCEYDAESNTFVYIVCAMTPANTPVPEGFIYRDIPETDCAKGLYGENVSQTMKRAQEIGYTMNLDPYVWNAELYVQEEEDNPPKQADTPWHWIVPVKKKI